MITEALSVLCNEHYITWRNVITELDNSDIGDMEKYYLKPHQVYFISFPMWQQVLCLKSTNQIQRSRSERLERMINIYEIYP